MSGYRCVNYYELCRLCTKSSGTKINIFSEEGKKLKLYHKITESLPVNIDVKDKLPKIICEQCQQHVESIADFRETCINAENMLRGCLNSSKLRTGGKVYIKDVITKKVPLPPPSSPPSVTIAKTTISAASSNQHSTTNNDFLSSIIQAVGIQQNDDVPEIIQQAPQQISTPQYTLTLDGQALKTNQIQYKIEEPTITYNINEQTQTNYSQVDEFLKLNVKKTIPVKKEVKPPPVKVKVETPKKKKANVNLVITSPKPQQQQQQQHTQIVQQQQIQQQHHQISTPVTSQPHRIVLPLKFTDGAGEHQVVTQIDAKNLVLPTTTYFQMKLPPQFTTVDGQRVVHITPSQMPSISLTPTSIQNIQQSQHIQHHQNTQTISVSASTNTTPTTYHMTTTPTTQTPTFRITTQPTINTSSTTTNQQQTQTISMPTLQLSNFTPQTASSIQKQLSHNNIQIHVKHEPQQQQQLQQQQIHVPVSISIPSAPSNPPKLQTVSMPAPIQVIKRETTPPPPPVVLTTTASTTTSPSSSSSTLTTCDTCGKTFKRKEHLAQHMKLHIGLRPFKCEESGCTKAFSRKEHLMRHIVSHTGKKMFSCDICQKLFSRKDNLNKHRRTHPNETATLNANNFICNICQKGFAVKLYYLEHKAMHENEMETEEIKYTIKTELQDKQTKTNESTETTTSTVSQNQTHLMQIQIPTSMATSQTVTINSNQLKSMGSHDSAVLTLPNLTNMVQLNSHYVTSNGEMVRIENN